MIDAHVHFWRPDRGDYGWLTPELTTLYRDVMPDELVPQVAACGVSGVIAVQAAPTEDETRYLFALAREEPLILGVVGWVDLATPDAAKRLAVLVSDGGGLLKGVRPMLQDLADPDWVARPELDAGFAAVVAHDLVFDALIRVEHLPALAARIARSPALRVVIDHGAKPAITRGDFTDWDAAMTPFAAMPGVACKLSGLLTESDASARIDRYAAWLVEQFGPDRLIWGSDWPILTLAADYATWHAHARRLVDEPAVFGDNARRIYRLSAGGALLVLQPQDNVGVALRPLAAGEAVAPGVAAADTIGFGFKVALGPIAAGDKIVKYGVSIGSATCAIAAGGRVHLENMQSDYTATHTRELKDMQP